MALCEGAASSVPWQGTTVAASANARTAGSMAASSAAGVAAGERQHHHIEILVRVPGVIVIVVMIVVDGHARDHDARERNDRARPPS